MKTTELENIARCVCYKEPDLPQDEWSEDDITNYVLEKALNHYIYHRCLHLMLSWFPPMKLVYKNKLKMYISEFSGKKYNEQSPSLP